MVIRAALVAALASACSYGPAFEDCTVTCHGPSECPDGFACGSEGLCRLAGGKGTCNEVLGDANLTGGDGGNGHCTGTPTACSTFVPMGDCLGQDGCTFTASTCKLTTDCSAITTNTQCMATDGCATDFSTSTCKPVSGYCHGSTQAACEAIASCAYAGGCAGTPRTCASYSDESGCTTHGGCSYN